MKIKILIAAVTFVALSVLSAAGFYIYKNLNRPTSPTESPNVPSVINNGEAGSGEGSDTKNEEVLKEIRLVKNDFEITLPLGWQEATSSFEGILAMAIDDKEDVSGSDFKKLDFRTNLSIKSDNLEKYSNLDTLEKYVESVKVSLIQAIPGISFVQEEQKTINGFSAISIECSSRQKDADFKTLLVFVKGNDSIIYAISFNTFQSSWEKYKSVFEQIAQSFKLKYKIEL